ncbi:MAG TPA: sigma 54-interacting transcriptional regulator [Gemmatimonadaceae bacterium]|nr:sigma 54-interacting transcriptional regulator [Gemmatimonadaceae bacterium]
MDAIASAIARAASDGGALRAASVATDDARIKARRIVPPPGTWFASQSESFMRAQIEAARLARDDRLPILITGETGTGKSYFARYIHDCSPRRKETFETCSLASLHEGTAASDLRGHVKGAYTGAEGRRHGRILSAEGGTLFLDEVGKASREVQKMLLHVVERREVFPVGGDRSVPVNVRMIFAANERLEEMVARGEFLPDLFHRIGYAQVKVPPLRERPEDIPLLAAEIIAKHAAAMRLPHVPSIEPLLMLALQATHWEGNVRQLDGALQVLLAMSDGATALTLDHRTAAMEWLIEGLLGSLGRRSRTNMLSREHAELALTYCRGSKTRAARLLHVSRQTLYKALKRPWQSCQPAAASAAAPIPAPAPDALALPTPAPDDARAAV